MSTAKMVVTALIAVTMTFGLSGCSGASGNAESAEVTLHISDVSNSGLGVAQLDAEAKRSAVTSVDAVEPGRTLVVFAFGREVSTACEPIVATAVNGGNSEERAQLKKNLVAAMPDAYEGYVQCVRDDAQGGSAEGGSPIFGSLVEAMVAASAHGEVTTILLTTDGCSYGEGVRTCDKAMTKEGFAERVVDSMPASLLPDLSGIELTVAGLGQGTRMNSQQVSVLRGIFTRYAAATGANVSFR